MALCKAGCGRHAQVLGGEGQTPGYCFFCDPLRSADEKRATRARGGRASRKVQPLALDDLPETIDDVVGLKQFLMSVIRSTVDGRITPTQARALVGAGVALRDCLELELIEQLAARREELAPEAEEPLPLLEGEAWRLVENSDN